MRRVFGNELDLIRIYRSNHLMDTYQPAEPSRVRRTVNQKEAEIDFSQMLSKEIEALSMI